MFVRVVPVIMAMPVRVGHRVVRVRVAVSFDGQQQNRGNKYDGGRDLNRRDRFAEHQRGQADAEKRSARKHNLAASCAKALRGIDIEYDAQPIREHADANRAGNVVDAAQARPHHRGATAADEGSGAGLHGPDCDEMRHHAKQRDQYPLGESNTPKILREIRPFQKEAAQNPAHSAHPKANLRPICND